MRVLIFGGTGWVGHHISSYLAEDGYDVTVCARGQKKIFLNAVGKINFIQADKSDVSEVQKIFEAQKYDIVIDTVPHVDTIYAIYKHACGLKHYLHCSSTGGYAPLPFIPCDETSYYEGFASGWKTGKKVVDNKVLDLCYKKGFPATVIRPSYITGTGGLLPLDNLGGRRQDFISDIIANKQLDLPDNGLTLLHPVLAKDIAQSFSLAVKTTRSIGQVYNICLEKAITLNRYLEITSSVFGNKPNINHIPLEEMLKKYKDQVNEYSLRFFATHMCFDISKACEQLGYQPSQTTDEAIEDSALWASKQLQE